MDANEPIKNLNANDESTPKSALPTWCKAVFVIDIIVLALTSAMLIRILTGGWQESITKNFGNDPALLQSAYLNAVITFLLVVVGIIANVFLLKLRRIGIILGIVAQALVLLAIVIQLWGAANAKDQMAMSIQMPISVLRIIYNSIYLLALLKARKTINSKIVAA